MRSEIHPDLIAVLDVVEVLSPTSYRIRGETRDVPSAGVAPPGDSAALLASLREDIYGRVYTRATGPVLRPPADAQARGEFLAALSSANTGRGTWGYGWTVRRLEDDGRVVVSRDGLTFWADSSEVRAAGDRVSPGAPCQVRVGKELRHLDSGFYFARGDGDADLDPGRADGGLVRLYWNLCPDTAAPFIAATTGLLNGTHLPFQIKVLSDPRAYVRADAGVIYIRRRDYPQCADDIARVKEAVSSGLRADVPFFTKRLADGLGVAEDPTDGSSFGEHRCRLIAEALWCGFTLGLTDRDSRADVLEAAFRGAGLDPGRPHLQPHSTDLYSLPPNRVSRGGHVAVKASAPESPLDAAARIGRALCQQAIWGGDGQLCNWVGGMIDANGGPPGVQALGYDLYDGSAGVALFLAELYSLTGDSQFRLTALGAVARSVRQLERNLAPRASPVGLFTGNLGVAYVACRARDLTDFEGLDDRVVSLLDRVADAAAVPQAEMDVIGGHAGAIPALLALGQSVALPTCRMSAVALGEALCRAAERRGPEFVWPPAACGIPEGARFLTGLAHGAAGFGLALLELHAATGRPDFLEAGRGAFAYEDSLFDPERGNWPDLRPRSRLEAAADPGAPRFMVAWCHGAAGIALARLRAAALDPAYGAAHAAIAHAALATVRAALDRGLEEPGGDVSLCHGLSGLAEVVGIAGELTGDATYRDRAIEALCVLTARHSVKANWPSGVMRSAPNPSLMLGIAGVGHALLRRHDPARVPPVLILLPERGKAPMLSG
jgi:hypothetical protein